MFTVFHNLASDILRGSKQWWTLADKISRGSGPLNPRRIDAYAYHIFARKISCHHLVYYVIIIWHSIMITENFTFNWCYSYVSVMVTFFTWVMCCFTVTVLSGRGGIWYHSIAWSPKPTARHKDLEDISYTSQVIAYFVLHFVTMTTWVIRW